MSELKATTIYDAYWKANSTGEGTGTLVYLKYEVDKVISDLEESHKMEVAQLLIEIVKLKAMLKEHNKQVGELKDRIAPKQSDKTLQERLNEVCEKHGVSTLQDLDWAFCESEKRRTKDNIYTAKILRHHKFKRCLSMSWWCSAELGMLVSTWEFKIKHYKKWQKRWLELAEKFKEAYDSYRFRTRGAQGMEPQAGADVGRMLVPMVPLYDAIRQVLPREFNNRRIHST